MPKFTLSNLICKFGFFTAKDYPSSRISSEPNWGQCALADGRATQAEVSLKQALEIFQRIGAAGDPDLVAELAALSGPPPA